jgi:uncharacterized protein YggE
MSKQNYLFSTILLVGILVAGFVIVGLPGDDVSAAPQEQGVMENTITVTGKGSIQAEPDIAFVNVGVETTNADVTAAVAEANASIESVTAALGELGIAEEDVRTDVYNIFQENLGPPIPTESNMEGAAERQFRVFIMLNVTVRDIDNIGTVLAEAIEAGANNVNSIRFGIEDRSLLEDEARALALQNARARAEHIAGELQVNVLAPVRVEAFGDAGVFPVAEAAMSGMGGGGGVPIETGSLSVTITVNVTYSFQ